MAVRLCACPFGPLPKGSRSSLTSSRMLWDWGLMMRRNCTVSGRVQEVERLQRGVGRALCHPGWRSVWQKNRSWLF